MDHQGTKIMDVYYLRLNTCLFCLFMHVYLYYCLFTIQSHRLRYDRELCYQMSEQIILKTGINQDGRQNPHRILKNFQ